MTILRDMGTTSARVCRERSGNNRRIPRLLRCAEYNDNFRTPEVEEFRMNLYEAKTPLLGKGGGGSFKLPLESVRRLNEPPRLRPAEVASRHFIDGRSHPSFAKEGNSGSFCFPRLLQIVGRDQDL